MRPEQLEQFKAAIIAAVDNHIANGGRLTMGSFGFGKAICPVSCVAQRTPSESTLDALDRSFEFETDHEEIWDFIYGFDGLESYEAYNIELYRFGQEVRHKYADHIQPRPITVRKLGVSQ